MQQKIPNFEGGGCGQSNGGYGCVGGMCEMWHSLGIAWTCMVAYDLAVLCLF